MAGLGFVAGEPYPNSPNRRGMEGGMSLEGQMQAMGSFDPASFLNYSLAVNDYLTRRNLQLSKPKTLSGSPVATRTPDPRFNAQQARGAAPDPTRRFMTIKQDLDTLQSRDPWAGRGYGQTQGQSYFNMPAASALAFGQNVFPNGFDAYSKLAAASGGVNPALRGPQTPWGQGY